MSSIVQHAPKFTEDDAVRIAEKLFAFDATAKLLPSERDQNFRLTTAADESFVLKIANPTELEAVLDFQNQAMMHICEKRDKKPDHIAEASDRREAYLLTSQTSRRRALSQDEYLGKTVSHHLSTQRPRR